MVADEAPSEEEEVEEKPKKKNDKKKEGKTKLEQKQGEKQKKKEKKQKKKEQAEEIEKEEEERILSKKAKIEPVKPLNGANGSPETKKRFFQKFDPEEIHQLPDHLKDNTFEVSIQSSLSYSPLK